MIFKNKNLVLYMAGKLVSSLGNGIYGISMLLYILDKCNAASMIGLYALLSTLPKLITLPFMGVIGDKYNRKKIMVSADLLNGMLFLSLFLVSFTSNLFLVYIFVAQAIMTIFDMLFRSATRAMVPELVEKEDLVRFNSVVIGIDNVSETIGPLIGVIIYGFYGITAVLLLNGVSFVLSGISEMFINYKPMHREKVDSSVRNTIFLLKEGFQYILARKGLKKLCIFYTISSAISIPLLTVILPFIFKKDLKFANEQFAFLQIAFVVGMILGCFLLFSLFSKKDSRKLIFFSLKIEAFMMCFLTFTIFFSTKYMNQHASWQYFFIYIVILIVLGSTDIFWDAPIEANLQKMIPNNLRSRVLSTLQMIFGLGIPLGQALCGFLLDIMPPYQILTILTIIEVLIIFFFISTPNEVFEVSSTCAEST